MRLQSSRARGAETPSKAVAVSSAFHVRQCVWRVAFGHVVSVFRCDGRTRGALRLVAGSDFWRLPLKVAVILMPRALHVGLMPL